jgi:hypothetical protein
MAALVEIEPAFGGGCWAEVPCLPECRAWGLTRKDALRNIKKVLVSTVAKYGGWRKTPIRDYKRDENGDYEVVEFYGPE